MAFGVLLKGELTGVWEPWSVMPHRFRAQQEDMKGPPTWGS